MMKKILFALAAVMMSLTSMGHDLSWSQYNLNFSVPDGGFETLNTPTRYERQWEDMALSIQLYTKVEQKQKDLYTSTLMRKASDFNMYEVKNVKLKVKNFECYAIEGIMPDGTRGLLANLVSKKSDMVVQITINYLFGNREAVDDVVKSFSENPDHKPNKEVKKQKVQKKPSASEPKPSKEQLKKEQEIEKERIMQEKRRSGVIHDI